MTQPHREEPLLIIGAGGFARETAHLIDALNRAEPYWNLLGFADDDPAKHGFKVAGRPILGSPEEAVAEHPEARVLICIGTPRNYFSKGRVRRRLGIEDDRYATLIHPGAHISGGVEIGEGSVILAGAVATGDAHIGRHVGIMPNVVITHDDTIGDCTFLAAGSALAGRVVVNEDVYVGTGALVREEIEIGRGAQIGMGAVVRHAVPAFEVWVGNPARKLRDVPQA